MNKLEKIAKRREETLQLYPDLARELTDIRGKLVNDSSNLLSLAQETLKAKGCQVYYAKSDKDAQEILSKILKGQEQIVRAYSNTLKEIDIDKYLEKENIAVEKTNISEIILEELGSTTEGHPIIPYMGLTSENVVEGLKKYLNINDINDPKELNKLTQKRIREKIKKSDFGVTGINCIVAENGTAILAEDEGNCRAVSNLPYNHVIIAGIEKITSTVEEAMTTIQGATIYGLGRKVPTYFSLISGPSRTADIEFKMAYGMHGPKEVHVILLDNGRTSLLEQKCDEVLKCIDCGACFESCSNFAKANNWNVTMKTPKSIALGIVQGKIQKLSESVMDDFTCPVGLDGKKVLEVINSIKIN